MSETKRMTSIAKRMNRSWLWRLFWTLLLVDFVILAMLIAGWCYAAEKTTLGNAWTPKIDSRSFIVDETLVWYKRLDTAIYTFTPEGKQSVSVQCGPYFPFVRGMFAVLLSFEGIFLLIQYGSGKRKAKRLLEPLTKMARTAQELSRKRFDPEKLHSLENAIANVSPLAPEAKLTTGDRDLVGLEDAINNLMSRMQESYQQQSRFVSDASHELRTPIAVIAGYADMLNRWGKNDEKVLGESITAIQSESQHMQKLVEQLLFLARGDSGRNKLTFESVDLSALMQEVYDEYRMIDPKHRWRLQAGEDIIAFGDMAMLKQTARILVDNAIKYTKEDETITLRTRKSGSVPCFEVQDNGEGISAEDLPHIFERFYRADPARTRQTGGTGLGLSIAKWIVDKHEGYFDMLSRPGIGTRIAVCLPMKMSESSATQTQNVGTTKTEAENETKP